MFKNCLAEKLRDGKVVLGLGNMYPSSGIIENMCREWDFVWLDGQHGQHWYESLLRGVQTASAVGTDTVIRTPGHENCYLSQYADILPSAIMVPMVNNTEDAHKIVGSLRFPPLGNRSFGGRRPIDLVGRDYYKDSELIVIAQIETLQAADKSYEIIMTEGIDMIFFGPDDMKISMGIPVNVTPSDNKELANVMEQIGVAAHKAGKFCGCTAVSKPDIDLALSFGYQMLICGADSGYIRTGSSEKLKEVKNFIGEKTSSGKNQKPFGVY